MAYFTELYKGRFLSKESLPTPKHVKLVAINVTKLEGEKGIEDKVTLRYEAKDGAGEIVSAKTNAILAAAALGTRDYTKWIGQWIAIYHDPRVRFGPKAVGGIRVYGAPTLTKPIKVEIKMPRKKTPDIYELVPTGKNAKAAAAVPEPVAVSDREPGVDDDESFPGELPPEERAGA